MRVIVKYRLAHINRQLLDLPKDTAFLGLAFEKNELHFWAEVDLNDGNIAPRCFYILEEGDTLPSAHLVQVGDVQPPEGKRWFVFFEYGNGTGNEA